MDFTVIIGPKFTSGRHFKCIWIVKHLHVLQDYYDVLGVSRNASKSEIKSGG